MSNLNLYETGDPCDSSFKTQRIKEKHENKHRGMSDV